MLLSSDTIYIYIAVPESYVMLQVPLVKVVLETFFLKNRRARPLRPPKMNYFPYTGLDFIRAMFIFLAIQIVFNLVPQRVLVVPLNTNIQPSSKTFPMQGFFSTLGRLTEKNGIF